MENTVERICLWNNRRYEQVYSKSLVANMIKEQLADLREAHKEGDEVDTLKTLVDIMYISIGAMWKLGLDKDQIEKAILAVCDSNETKIALKTAHTIKANIIKGSDYKSPEKKLEAIIKEVRGGKYEKRS